MILPWFANFYPCSIHNLGSISHPLTSLLKVRPKSLSWTLAAAQAMQRSSAPLQVHPDPEKPFVVRAILSQQFSSKKLTPVEKISNIRNRELLSIKLALEEWRHWLEWAPHSFTVLKVHKNLEYPPKATDGLVLHPIQRRSFLPSLIQ